VVVALPFGLLESGLLEAAGAPASPDPPSGELAIDLVEELPDALGLHR
jgi:hypothetical protein